MAQIVCPKCGHENKEGVSNCANCGINLQWTLEHPEAFAADAEEMDVEGKVEAEEEQVYPIPAKVKSAFVPSGKTSPRSVVFIALGGILGIPLGYLAALVSAVLSMLLLSGAQGPGIFCSVPLVILALVGIVLLPTIPGIVIGGLAGIGAKWGKGRNPQQAGKVAAVVSFIGVVLPVVVSLVWVLVTPDSTQDLTAEGIPSWLVLVGGIVMLISALLSPVVAYDRAVRRVEERKFCEECQMYLKARRVGTLPLEKTGEAVLHLSQWNLSGLSEILQVPVTTSNHCEMILWTCYCQTNFLELVTQGKIDNKKYNGIRVFSAKLSLQDMEALTSLLDNYSTY